MEEVFIDIGCGRAKAEGAIGVDCDPTAEPDILCDITEGLPFEDDSVDRIYTANTLEHIPADKSTFVLSEIWRVCKQGAIIQIVVPSYGHPSAHTPEHPVSWSERAFGSGDLGKGPFLSWFEVTALNFDYDAVGLERAKKYFPEIPDEDLARLFLGVAQHIRVTCTPKGKDKWTQHEGRRKLHWAYYAFYDEWGVQSEFEPIEDTMEVPPCESSPLEEQAISDAS